MAYSKIEISGLRGFGTKQILKFGIPNGSVGSGLTTIVGPNNAGKSTVTEAINAFTGNEAPSFPEGKRNIKTLRTIEITLTDTSDRSLSLKTVDAGGSEAKFEENGLSLDNIKPFIVPSRRMFNPSFGKLLRTRDAHIVNYQLPAQRGKGFHEFAYRLFQIQADPTRFNLVLSKVLENAPDWNIDQQNDGNYYLKFIYGNSEHSSDGAGEGLLSIFIIVDALYDSNPNDLIVIDEPELSVHPSLQKKLIELLADYAKDRQIVISTHSPYFINWDSITNGGTVARVIKEIDTAKIYQLSEGVTNQIKSSLNGINNPHVFGLTSNEVFFLEEQIILVEGQEDVVIYKKILKDNSIELKGDFYGWGVGGADNMKNIAAILKDIGFKKVFGILDLNMTSLISELKAQFPDYEFLAIPTDDVRDKPLVREKSPVNGLATSNGELKEEYKDPLKEIFISVNSYFSA